MTHLTTEITETPKKTRAKRSSVPKVPKGFEPTRPIGNMSYRKRRARFLYNIGSSIVFFGVQFRSTIAEVQKRRAAVAETLRQSTFQIGEAA